MPIIAPIVAGAVGVSKVVVAGTVLYVAGTEVIAYFVPGADGTIDKLEASLTEAGVVIATESANEIGGITIQFVEGFGSAFVRGLDAAYDTIRQKLIGQEDKVIAGFTVGALAILTGIAIYQSAKATRDVF